MAATVVRRFLACVTHSHPGPAGHPGIDNAQPAGEHTSHLVRAGYAAAVAEAVGRGLLTLEVGIGHAWL